MMLARSESRDGYAVRVLAVHTTEGSGTAESLRDAAWWTGSSHALADERGKLLTPADGCVPYNLAAWTLRSGNRWSENIELVGFAKWKRDDWLARPKLLDACARWLAERSVARGIPLVKLSPKEYAAGRSGVIGHVDHTVGYSDGTHWDPGPDFPYDVVLDKARAYADTTPSPQEDELSAEFEKEARELLGAIHYMLIPQGGWAGEEGAIINRIGALQYVLGAQSPDIDEEKLASALAPTLVPAVLSAIAAKNTGLTKDDVEAAIREVLGSLGTPA